jgi:multiple sugar transport system permease protein
MDVLTEAHVVDAYIHSLEYSFLTILGSLLLTSLAAFEFALFNFPGKKFLFTIVLLALMIPTAVTLVPTYLVVAKLGWINTMQGLVVPGLASAFGLFMLTQFFKDIPRELMDAALIDGANHFGVYWHIVLPLSRNALITLAILTFMTTWGNFIWPMVIAKNFDIVTVSQMINWYNDPNSFMTVNLMMTAFLLASILPIIVYIIFQRQIIQGISITGMKG